MEFLILLIIGILGGILAGTLGVGGGIIFTPVLLFLFQDSTTDPVPWVIGTSLLCTFFAALSSSYRQFAKHNLFLKESVKIGIGGLVGTIIGRLITLSTWYNQEIFTVVFSSILIFTAIRFAIGKSNKVINEDLSNDQSELSLSAALLTGMSGGFLATIAGVGGGIVMVPILTMFVGFSFMKSTSISSAVIVIISFFGWFQFATAKANGESLSGFSLGFVDYGAALPLIIGTLAGAWIGVNINHKVKKRLLEIAFSILAFAVVTRLLSQL